MGESYEKDPEYWRNREEELEARVKELEGREEQTAQALRDAANFISRDYWARAHEKPDMIRYLRSMAEGEEADDAKRTP